MKPTDCYALKGRYAFKNEAKARPTRPTLVKDAWRIVGGLSKPGKMPCYGYSIPAKECGIGSILRTIPGSTCFECYARKGRYAFPNVEAALYRRLESLSDPRWVDAMAFLIGRYGPYFRWHDSGDVQSLGHLEAIAEVAKRTPNVTHWLPTREYTIVKAYIAKHGAFPPNLIVRLSAHMVNGLAPTGYGLPVSTVHTGAIADTYPSAYACPASLREGQCGTCRACWLSTVKHVSYHKH